MRKYLLSVLVAFIILSIAVPTTLAVEKNSPVLPEETTRILFEDFKRFIKEAGDYSDYGFKTIDEIDRAAMGDIDFIYGFESEKLPYASKMIELFHEKHPIWQVIVEVDGTPVTSIKITKNEKGDYILNGWGGEVKNFMKTKSDFKQFLKEKGVESELKATKIGTFIMFVGETNTTEYTQVSVPGSLSYEEFKREPVESGIILDKLKNNQKKAAEALNNPAQMQLGISPEKGYLELMEFQGNVSNQQKNNAANPLIYYIMGAGLLLTAAFIIKRKSSSK